MPFESLRAQDATLLCAQDPAAPLQIGAVATFAAAPLRDRAGAIRIDALREHVQARITDLPRFRQRLAGGPLPHSPPVWIDDAGFAIEHHVRLAALPAPGDDRTLREHVAHLLETPLDVRRPLWTVWVIDGLDADRVAVVPIVSHVMADGMALLAFALAVLDLDAPDPPTGGAPGGSPPASVPHAVPVPLPASAPGTVELVLGNARERATRALGAALTLGDAARHPLRLTRDAVALARAGAGSAALAPALPITAPVGPHRDVAWLRVPIAPLLAVKADRGVRLNDVVLAVVAGGLRDYLAQHGVDVDRVRPRVIVPVSTHGHNAAGETENRFSMMIADLPVDIADPVDRLAATHEEMEHRKQLAQVSMSELLFHASDVVPARLLRAVGPIALRHQPFVNLAVTNLPGTTATLSLLGAPMLDMFPLVTVTGNIAVIVGVVSYRDALCVGITVDADVVTDLDALVAAMRRGIDALVDTPMTEGTPNPPRGAALP